MTRAVDNNGIGAMYATFEIHKTEGTFDLAPGDIGCAVSLSASNEVNKGTDGGALLGRLMQMRGQLATVQVRGVVRLGYNTGKTVPSVGNRVVVDGAGKVYQTPALTEHDSAGGAPGRGTVIAVDTSAKTCDVLI